MSEPQQQPTLPVHPSTKAALLITWGDEDGSGKPDLNIRTFGVVPFVKGGLRKMLELGPFNIPVDEAQAAVGVAVAALPIPAPAKLVAQGAVSAVFGVLRVVL